MDNGSSSCVKVLYSACDSVSAFNEVVSSNWDRSPQMVLTKSQFCPCKKGVDISTAANAISPPPQPSRTQHLKITA